MNALLWILIVVAIVVVIGALFALIRNRQRSGDILASRPAKSSGGTR